MANEISIYEPRCLAEVVRTTPPVRTFFLDNYFTNVKTFATKSVDIDVVKGDRRMASFVHPLVGGQVLKTEGYQTESFTPPDSCCRPRREQGDRLRLHQQGEAGRYEEVGCICRQASG